MSHDPPRGLNKSPPFLYLVPAPGRRFASPVPLSAVHRRPFSSVIEALAVPGPSS